MASSKIVNSISSFVALAAKCDFKEPNWLLCFVIQLVLFGYNVNSTALFLK